MNIKEVKINGFGKLENRNIALDKHMNIIYGKNEAGKSTFLKFIDGMLYGLSKNKNGEIISDMEKYRPWENVSFSGKIKYEMDNGNIYEVYRDFNKKNPIIYNEFGENISDTFKKDKSRGITFFEEQSQISEDLYTNTAIVGQEKIRLKSASQISLVNRITNLATTGDDVISYKDTIERIKNKQLEVIGSDRTTQKPINRINSQIEYLTKEKVKLEQYKNNYANSESKRDELDKYLEEEKRKLQILKIEKDNLDKNSKIESEIDLLKNNMLDIKKKLSTLKQESTDRTYHKGNYLKDIVLTIILTILICVSWIFLKEFNSKLIITGVLSIFIFMILIKGVIRIRKNRLIAYKQIINAGNINSEINILNESYTELSIKYNEKVEMLDSIVESQYNDLIAQYDSKEEQDYINTIFDMSEKEITEEIEKMSNSIYETDVKIRLLKQDIENSNQKIEQLIQLEEQLDYLYSEKRKLEGLNNIYNMTKICIEEAYLDIKKSISPKYKNNISSIINEVSKGKYSRVEINDDNIMVETEYGEMVPINLLSTGTIDQIFLSLRLSVLDEITSETLPVFFDETFAFFDDDRLENIINYLREYHKSRQICIFTCSKREIDILENMGVEYNLIKM